MSRNSVDGDANGDVPRPSQARKSAFVKAKEYATQRKPLFPDAKQMKKELRENMHEYKYDVADFYWEEGHFQHLARLTKFENITLAVISFNALWISIDTEYNTADTLDKADPPFIVAENFFCLYFTFEVIVRFGAFQNKMNCLRDAWFVFDSFMVTMMIMETWVMPIAMKGKSMGNTGVLKLLRLLRLSRLARLARLLRSMPELLILIKPNHSAVRSVFFTLLLLVLLMYVFAILFRQTTAGTDVGDEFFPTIPTTMHTLLQYGVFCDSISVLSFALGEIDVFPYLLMNSWFSFVLFAALTVMNMLVGVLCEVIGTVAITEKEEMTICFVREALMDIVCECVTEKNEDGEPIITKADFIVIFEKPETADLLADVDVDVFALVDLVDTIFADEDGGERSLDFGDLLEVLLDHRSSSAATVNHITSMRKYCHSRLNKMSRLIDGVAEREKTSGLRMQASITTLAEMLERISGKVAGSFIEQTSKREAELVAEYRKQKAEEEAKRKEDAGPTASRKSKLSAASIKQIAIEAPSNKIQEEPAPKAVEPPAAEPPPAVAEEPAPDPVPAAAEEAPAPDAEAPPNEAPSAEAEEGGSPTAEGGSESGVAKKKPKKKAKQSVTASAKPEGEA